MELLKVRKGYLTLLKGNSGTGKTTIAILDMLNRIYLDEKALFIELESNYESFFEKLVTYFDYDSDTNACLDIANPIAPTLDDVIELIQLSKAPYVYIDYCGLMSNKHKGDLDYTRKNFALEIIHVLSKIASESNIGIALILQGPIDYASLNDEACFLGGIIDYKSSLNLRKNKNIIPMLIEQVGFNHCESNTYLLNNDGILERYSNTDVKKIYGEDF